METVGFLKRVGKERGEGGGGEIGGGVGNLRRVEKRRKKEKIRRVGFGAREMTQ